jgi:hypothetical protein
MRFLQMSVLFLLVISGSMLAGCGSSDDALPTEDEIQAQLQQDKAMRAEEDRLEAAGQ